MPSRLRIDLAISQIEELTLEQYIAHGIAAPAASRAIPSIRRIELFGPLIARIYFVNFVFCMSTGVAGALFCHGFLSDVQGSGADFSHPDSRAGGD